MRIQFQAEEITIGPHRSVYYVDVEADVESSEADDIFDCIKKEVDHDKMMACLTEEEMLEHLGIEDGE